MIINVTGTNTYSYNGYIRNTDGGSNGGVIALTKTGSGTQVLSGGMSCTGPTLVNAGVLRINNSLASATVTVTGTGQLEGTGSLGGALSVNSGGVFSPGVAGVGTFASASPVSIGSGGSLLLAGTTLNGGATVASGGVLSGTGTISGAVSVQAGGTFTPGTAGIGILNTNSSLNLAGTSTFEINKSGAVLANDLVSGFSAVTYGGTLAIVATGDTPVLGDSFQLFTPASGGTFGGGFTSITGLPALGAGLQWETTSLLTNGSISVVNTTSAPGFSPAGGGYIGAQAVTITSDSGSTIYYTLDGSTPNLTSTSGTSPVTGVIIPDNAVTILKAFAKKTGFSASPVVTAEYRTVTAAKWNVDNDGNWSEAPKWLNQVVPGGSGVTADFTFDETANATVTLAANRTIGNLIFGNTNPFVWNIASTGGTLTLAVPSGTPSINTLNVDTYISAPIAGSQGLAKSGPGTLNLSNNNTYGGNTAVNGGVLSVNAFAQNGFNSPLGTGSTLSLDGGTLSYTGAGSIGFLTFNRAVTFGAGGGTLDTSTGGFWFTSGTFSGPGSFTKIGDRQLIIQANNTYDGSTFVNVGEVQFRTLDAFGSTVGNTVVADPARVSAGGGVTGTITENFQLNGFGGGNGALQSNDGGTNVTYAGNIDLATDSGIGGGANFVISGPIGGAGGLTKLSANAVTLSGTVSNSYLGMTTLSDTGKLVLAKTGGALAIPGNINLSSTGGGVANSSGIVLAGNEQIVDSSILTWTLSVNNYLRLNGFTETIGGLVAAVNPISPAIENRGLGDAASYGTGTLIINTTGTNSYSYAGVIRDIDQGSGGGNIAITKTGTGSQALSGTLSYSGPTTVMAGTLEIDSVTNSPITVKASGTLMGTGGTTAALAVQAGGTLAPGASAGTFTAGPSMIAGTYACEIDGASADRLTVTGALDISGSTLAFTTLNAPTAPFYVIASYSTTLTGTFTVTGKPSGYSVVYNATSKEIQLVSDSAGFAAYALTKGLSGNPNADFDNDGLSDAIEYVLGTDPKAATGGAPAVSLAGGNLIFTFVRDHASITPDVAVAVEVGTTLGAWPAVYKVGIDTLTSDSGITVTNNGATDTIKLTVATTPDTKKFARLRVIIAPPAQ